jgi:hypothetical protein
VPRIPTADVLGERRSPTLRAPVYQDQSGEIVGEAVGNAARTLGGAVMEFADRRDDFRMAKAGAEFAKLESTARQFDDNDWETYEDRFRKTLTQAKDGILKNVKQPRNREALGLDLDSAIERGALTVKSLSRAKEVEFGRADLNNMLESYRTSALSSGDEMLRQKHVVGAQTALKAALDNRYIDPTDFERLSKDWTQSYAGGYLDTLPFAKQVEILRKPEGTPAAFLPPDARANMLRQAENQLRIEQDRAEAQRNAGLIEMRQALTDQLRDITVGATMGLPVNVPAKAVLQAAFGEREGAQRYDLAVSASKLSGDVSQLQHLPTDKLIARVDSYKPSQTEGAADQTQLYGAISSSARQIIQARAEDPAGYLAQFAPKTQAAWQAFQSTGDESTRDAYFAAVEADRERLGLPKGDILPNAYAKSLAEEIANPKSAEKLASLMEAEAQRWGDRWGDVHAQIAKDLPDIAAVIGSGVDRSAAVTLASTSGLKESDLKAMLPPSVKWGDVQADVASTFDEVRRSFPVEGARTWQAIQDSALRLSVSYMQAGASKGNAIDRAYKDLIGKQYEVGTVKDVPFLVPRQIGGRPIDAGDVEDEAQRLIDDFTPSVDMIAAPPGSDSAAFIERATEKMREEAYWVARGDGNGLRMYLGARPTPVSYDFQQLAAMAAARRANDQAEVKRLREAAQRARGPR